MQMSLNGIDISFTTSFNILVGTEQGPEDFEPSKLVVISIISWGVVGEIMKEMEYDHLDSMLYFQVFYKWESLHLVLVQFW